jgi:hypothetical protein
MSLAGGAKRLGEMGLSAQLIHDRNDTLPAILLFLSRLRDHNDRAVSHVEYLVRRAAGD